MVLKMNIQLTQNQLIYTTVRIVASDGLNCSIGTGYFVDRSTEEESIVFFGDK